MRMKTKTLLLLASLSVLLFMFSGCGNDKTIYLDDYINSGSNNGGTVDEDPADTGDDDDGGGEAIDPSTMSGEELYTAFCGLKGCHAAFDSVVMSTTVEHLENEIATKAIMNTDDLKALTEEQLGRIVDALNARSSGTDPSEMDGDELYTAYCQSCHGDKASTTVNNQTVSDFKAAITDGTGGMDTDSLKALTDAQLQLIADVLVAAGGGSGGGSASDGQTIFTASCSCHNSLTISTPTLAATKTAISGNEGGMGAITLTDDQIEAALNYYINK